MLSDEQIQSIKDKWMGPDPPDGAKMVFSLLREREELIQRIGALEMESEERHERDAIDADARMYHEHYGDNYPHIPCRDGG